MESKSTFSKHTLQPEIASYYTYVILAVCYYRTFVITLFFQCSELNPIKYLQSNTFISHNDNFHDQSAFLKPHKSIIKSIFHKRIF